MQKFKVTFYIRKGRADDQGRAPISAQMHLNGRRTDVCSTGCYVLPKNWDSYNYMVKGRTGEALEINHKLQALSSELMLIFRRHEFEAGLSLEMLKAAYLNTLAKPSKSQSFICYFEEFNVTCRENIGKTIVYDTYTRYCNTLAQFKDFLRIKRRRTDITFAELNYELVKDFEHYLRIDMDYDHLLS